MSRSGNRKPVGFATHITAGGIAGACEAVSVFVLLSCTVVFDTEVVLLCMFFVANVSAAGYDQGAHAAVQIGTDSGCESESFASFQGLADRWVLLLALEQAEGVFGDGSADRAAGDAVGVV